MSEQPPSREVRHADGQLVDAGLAWALHDFFVATAAVDQVLADRLGLGPTDYLAMKHLMVTSSPVGPVELGGLLGLSSGSATGLVDRLERSGHVERRRHPADRRRLIVQPTPWAVSRILDELEPLTITLDRLAETFTPGERQAIERFLRQAADRHRAFRASSSR